MRPHRIVNIEDLRLAARRSLPRVVFDYIDGGADGEITLRENMRAFETVTFRPRCAVRTPECDLRRPWSASRSRCRSCSRPSAAAGCSTRAARRSPRRRPARRHAYILSTFSGCRLEDVKAASTGPCLLQLYLVGDRDVSRSMMRRAQDAGYSALVVTIDTAVAGMRERDFRNGSRELVAASSSRCCRSSGSSSRARAGWSASSGTAA